MTYPSSPAATARSLAQYVVPGDIVPPNKGVVSVWTGVNRAGTDWLLARTFRVVSVMGGVELDLREARIGEGVSTIEIRCLWGGVDIKVPNDVFLEFDVDAIAGGAEVKRIAPSVALPGAPTIRITGTVLMGGVEVKVMSRDSVTQS